MLEGLEVSVVRFSELFLDNEKFRLDNEFFQKKYLLAYRVIKKKKYTTIGKIISCLTDFHSNGSYETIAKNFELLDKPDYAYMVRSTDLETQNYETNIKYISKHTYNFLSKSKVYGGELLINKIGIPGKTYIMPKLNRPVSLGMNLFLLRIKPDCNISEYFLWAFLNSKFGQNIIKRKINGTVPLTIDKKAIKSLYIPIVDTKIQDIAIPYILKSQGKLAESKKNYQQAEELLLETIGLSNFKSNTKGTNIKSFKKSFLSTGRLDAEYYLPKYEEIIAKVKKQPHDMLNNLVNIKKSIEPGSDVYSDEGLPFIRVSDYNKFGIFKPEKCLSNNFCKENETLLQSLYPMKETILFSKDGSVGMAYMVLEDMQAITSGAILHLKIKNKTKVLPLYLTLVLNSKVVQQQAERDVGGSIILHWRVNDIKNVIVPIVDYSIQQQIAKLINQSFSLRAESERLLDEAKNMVEREIEK